MKRILLVANAKKENALPLAHEAAAWLKGKAQVIGPDTTVDSDLAQYKADLVVVFGGDGTVLNAVRRLGCRQPPLLTVNIGHLGYLAEVSPDELDTALQRILDGNYRISERMLLHGHVLQAGKEIWHGHAVNEFVFSPETQGRTTRIRVEVDGRPLTCFRGDGLLVATPTGSTAYAMSAGGPIISPEMRAMVLVPICPHHLANRPLVLEAEEVLTIQHPGAGAARFSADGREIMFLQEDQVLKVWGSDQYFRLILGESLGRYDILRAKLGWGGGDQALPGATRHPERV